MTNLINEQLNLVLEDLELMTNPYERCMVRTSLINALSNMTVMDDIDSLPKGKDAIKPSVKTNNLDTAEKVEVTATEGTEETEETEETVETEEDVVIDTHTHVESEPPIQFDEEDTAVEEAPAPVEVDVDPNTADENTDGPIIVQVENEDGEIVDLDVTEAYELIKTEMTQEEKVELATTIAGYSLVPIYAQLTNLSDSELKATLAYQMQQVGLDELDAFVNELTDGRFKLFEFVNDDNLEYLTTSIEEAMSDEE